MGGSSDRHLEDHDRNIALPYDRRASHDWAATDRQERTARECSLCHKCGDNDAAGPILEPPFLMPEASGRSDKLSSRWVHKVGRIVFCSCGYESFVC